MQYGALQSAEYSALSVQVQRVTGMSAVRYAMCQATGENMLLYFTIDKPQQNSQDHTALAQPVLRGL